MGICPINKIYNDWTIPNVQRLLNRQRISNRFHSQRPWGNVRFQFSRHRVLSMIVIFKQMSYQVRIHKSIWSRQFFSHPLIVCLLKGNSIQLKLMYNRLSTNLSFITLLFLNLRLEAAISQSIFPNFWEWTTGIRGSSFQT